MHKLTFDEKIQMMFALKDILTCNTTGIYPSKKVKGIADKKMAELLESIGD